MFYTSPTWGVETIAGLIPIHFYLSKLISQYHLHVISLSKQYTINFILDKHYSKKTTLHCIAMIHLIPKQCLKIKNLIINTNNCLNEVVPFFDSLNKELSPGFHLVDTFHNHLSFLSVNQKDSNILTTHQNRLDNVYEDSLINQNTVLIILNASIKNNVVILISHIHRGQEIIAKSVHHTMNITSTKAKLFTIRCEINHVVQLQDIAHIIVITDTIPATKWIFDTSIHLYQLHSITISKDLRDFFNKNPNNSIDF